MTVLGLTQARHVIEALEVENAHLKETLSEMADALSSQLDRQTKLERLVVVWIGRANQASLRALRSERELNKT